MLLGMLHATCKVTGQLVQASNKIEAHSAEVFRDDDIIDAGQGKHLFFFFFSVGSTMVKVRSAWDKLQILPLRLRIFKSF